jgi:hypothetical protein
VAQWASSDGGNMMTKDIAIEILAATMNEYMELKSMALREALNVLNSLAETKEVGDGNEHVIMGGNASSSGESDAP